MSGYIISLEASGWLKHIRAILETSSFIAVAVDKGISVVVHCSDGWDRTAQVCSLAGLMLDPYYRTIKGFQALIEKDWLGFGHKFSERCGYTQTDSKEMSPVFTQFLDSAWQLLQQRCDAFEFNERFLLTLHDHVQSCQFGTFIGNCEKDRLDLRLSEHTFSLWGFMSNHLNEYINPLYHPEIDEIIKPSLAPQNIKFWRGMYSRFESGIHPREPLGDLLLATKDQNSSVEDHIQYLKKRIANVKAAISENLAARRAGSDNKKKIEVTDNRYNYDKKLSDLSNTVAEHSADKFVDPLMANVAIAETSESSSSNLKNITDEISSVAIDWKSLRNVTVCSCSTPFDQFSRKVSFVFFCFSSFNFKFQFLCCSYTNSCRSKILSYFLICLPVGCGERCYNGYTEQRIYNKKEFLRFFTSEVLNNLLPPSSFNSSSSVP